MMNVMVHVMNVIFFFLVRGKWFLTIPRGCQMCGANLEILKPKQDTGLFSNLAGGKGESYAQ
jgi:hypothetical protein